MKIILVSEQSEGSTTIFYSAYILRLGIKFWLTDTAWLTIDAGIIVKREPYFSIFKWDRKLTSDKNDVIKAVTVDLQKEKVRKAKITKENITWKSEKQL